MLRQVYLDIEKYSTILPAGSFLIYTEKYNDNKDSVIMKLSTLIEFIDGGLIPCKVKHNKV